MNRHKLLVLFGLVISIVTGFGSRASTQPYPDKPVNLVVGVSVGGLVDLATRQAAEQLQKKLGTPVLVQTRTGAGGAVAAQFVAQSQPDGYNLLSLTSGTFTAGRSSEEAALYRQRLHSDCHDCGGRRRRHRSPQRPTDIELSRAVGLR
jgi:tripartite-type tricarboxylate transporter receptor subunit TctC